MKVGGRKWRREGEKVGAEEVGKPGGHVRVWRYERRIGVNE